MKTSSQQNELNGDTSPDEGPMNTVETVKDDFVHSSTSTGDFGGGVGGRDSSFRGVGGALD